MLSKKIYRRKCVFLGLIFALLLLFFPVEAVARESSAPGAMVGFIYAQDLKTPVSKKEGTYSGLQRMRRTSISIM